jgi:hypothetical protein
MIRQLRMDEVLALRALADKGPGPLGCDCESSPDLCHCSTIMMLCDEWLILCADKLPPEAKFSNVEDMLAYLNAAGQGALK